MYTYTANFSLTMVAATILPCLMPEWHHHGKSVAMSVAPRWRCGCLDRALSLPKRKVFSGCVKKVFLGLKNY